MAELLGEAYGGRDSRYVPIARDDWLRRMTGDSDFEQIVVWLANPTRAAPLSERLGFAVEGREAVWALTL